MRIEILDEAEKDLIDGFAFYERRSKGLGVLSRFHLYAGIRLLHFGYHRLLAKRFPFAIYYRIQTTLFEFMQYWIAAGILHGFVIGSHNFRTSSCRGKTQETALAPYLVLSAPDDD